MAGCSFGGIEHSPSHEKGERVAHPKAQLGPLPCDVPFEILQVLVQAADLLVDIVIDLLRQPYFLL